VIASTRGFSNNTGFNEGRPIATYADNVGVIHVSPIRCEMLNHECASAYKGEMAGEDDSAKLIAAQSVTPPLTSANPLPHFF
jgi:hypothetical protein